MAVAVHSALASSAADISSSPRRPSRDQLGFRSALAGSSGLLRSAPPLPLRLPPRTAAWRCASSSYDRIPKQFREENLKDGLMDNFKNAPKYLYGLNPSQMDMFMTEDNPVRRQAEKVTEETISSRRNYLDNGGMYSLSGMKEAAPHSSLDQRPRVLLHFSSSLPNPVEESMAGLQILGAAPAATVPHFDGLRSAPSTLRFFSSVEARGAAAAERRCFRRFAVKSATVIAPKYTSITPLGDRVLVKTKSLEEKTTGGLFLPTSAQSKPQGGEVVAVGEGRSIGNKEVQISVQAGAQVVYSKYAGTELEFNGSNHLLLKEDDIVGILETDDIKDLKPLNDRVLIKIAEAEETTAGGLLLTSATKEKPSIGRVIAVGPGPLDEEGKRKPLSLTPESTVLYSKYAGSEFKGTDGSEYIVLRASDVIAVLPS